MRIYLKVLVLSLIHNFVIAQITEFGFNKTILFENKELEVFISCRDTASIDQEDWLKLVFFNKGSNPIFITDAYYSINNVVVPLEGGKYIDAGRYGRGNQFELFYNFFDKDDPSSHKSEILISPKAELSTWNHITDLASVYIESNEGKVNVCAKFQINLTYDIKGKDRLLSNPGADFSFIWKSPSEINIEKLVRRLKGAMLHKSITTSNTYIIQKLFHNADIVQWISNVDLIDAILRREKWKGTSDNILFLSTLKERNAIPNVTLTSRYIKDLQNPTSSYFEELMYYWENALLNDLLYSKIDFWRVSTILESNAPYWSVDSGYTSRIYYYLKHNTSFDENMQPSEVNYTEWSKTVKLMSISRDRRIIDYLIPFLENEEEFKVIDWSRYRNHGFLPEGSKPDTITVRVCDVAFVSLIRAINQTEYQNYYVLFNQNFIEKVKPSSDYVYGRNFITYDLALAEKTIKLNPELKTKIKSYITDMGRFQFINLQKGSH